MLKKMKSQIIEMIIDRSYLCLIIAFALTLSVLPFLWQQNFDFGPKAWFEKNDQNIKTLDYFERTFGNDESIILLAKLREDSSFNHIFHPSLMQTLEELTDQLWTVPDVMRVESIVNYQYTESLDDQISTESFIPEEMINNPKALLERKKIAQDHRVISKLFLDEGSKSTLIYGHLTHRPGQDPDNRLIVETLEEMLLSYSDRDFEFKLLGQAYLSDRYQIISFRDIFTTIPILLLLMVLYLWWSFRSLIGVLIPFGVILTTLISTIGLNGYLNLTVNSLTFILPSILMAISVADSVHLLSSFYYRLSHHNNWDRALRESLDKNLWPIFLTSISTAFGFFSLMSSRVEPVANLGLMAGIGILAAMIFSFLIVIPMLKIIGTHKRRELFTLEFGSQLLPLESVKSYIEFIHRNCRVILCLFSLISATGLWLALQNQINSNPYRYFKQNDPVSISNNYVTENFGGAGGPEIIIDSGVPDGVKNPKFLKRVESLKLWINEIDGVNVVVDIVDILKEMNQALHNGDAKEYRLNDEQDVIAQQLFLYMLGLPQGMDINNRVDYDYQKMRMSILWTLQDSRESLKAIEKIEEKAKELGLEIEVTGKGVLFQQMNDYVVNTFISSMTIALFLITSLMIIVFKSFSIGLMGLIPNFIPIILGAALLKLLGIPIDIATAIIASVTLGIAVDDTIHFLSHFAKLYDRDKSLDTIKEDLVEIIRSTGLALILTTMILVSCFGLFIFAGLIPNIIFGLMSALVITLALICDLFILPAFILWRKSRKAQ